MNWASVIAMGLLLLLLLFPQERSKPVSRVIWTDVPKSGAVMASADGTPGTPPAPGSPPVERLGRTELSSPGSVRQLPEVWL